MPTVLSKEKKKINGNHLDIEIIDSNRPMLNHQLTQKRLK